MRIIDFFFLYLARWFTKNKQKLVWSTALERAAYALAIINVFWFFAVWQILESFILKRELPKLPEIPSTIAVICLIFIYQYIYITRNRYDYLNSSDFRQFKITDRTAFNIIFIVVGVSFIFPIFLWILVGLKIVK